MKFIKVITAVFIILSSGCATLTNFGKVRFEVAVDSLASSPEVPGKTYLLLPSNNGITGADLEFQEYAEYLKRVLQTKGYVYTTSKEDANLVIYLSYGIGDPQSYHYSYSMPVWGTTGYSAARSTIAQTDDDGNTTYKTYTSYVPHYGFRGYRTYTDSVTAYNRFAVIAAYDYDQYKKDEKEIQLWKTTVSSLGTSDDLRRVFPILMTASVQYIATDTEHKVYETVFEDSDEVMKIKGEAVVTP